MDPEVDVLVIGGGTVGLATAREILSQRPSTHLLVLEKETEVARHQSGHNSGVIHSGIYYRPGSLKARLCVRGRERLLGYLGERGIAHSLIGKVIVATRSAQIGHLEELRRWADANGVRGVAWLDADGVRALEPEVRALQGLWVPGAGIVDYAAVCRSYAADISASGATVSTGAEVVAVNSRSDGVEVHLRSGRSIRSRFLVTCAGLYSDRIARMAGARLTEQIVPFRGEYYRLKPERRGLVRGLIYSVPDPRLPFADLHFTPTVHGDVEAGPNAVLALAREGYRRGVIRPREFGENFTHPGFLRMALRWWPVGAREAYRSLDRHAFVRDLQRMVPALQADDLFRGGVGVRAQAVGVDGRLCDDFVLAASPRGLHIVNAPSPAATSSLAIAEEIVSRMPAGL